MERICSSLSYSISVPVLRPRMRSSVGAEVRILKHTSSPADRGLPATSRQRLQPETEPVDVVCRIGHRGGAEHFPQACTLLSPFIMQRTRFAITAAGQAQHAFRKKLRAVNRDGDVEQRDACSRSGERDATIRATKRSQDPRLRQLLEDLREEVKGDVELLADRADRHIAVRL